MAPSTKAGGGGVRNPIFTCGRVDSKLLQSYTYGTCWKENNLRRKNLAREKFKENCKNVYPLDHTHTQKPHVIRS